MFLPPAAPWWAHLLPLGVELVKLVFSRAPAAEKKAVLKKSREKTRDVRNGGRIRSGLLDKEIS